MNHRMTMKLKFPFLTFFDSALFLVQHTLFMYLTIILWFVVLIKYYNCCDHTSNASNIWNYTSEAATANTQQSTAALKYLLILFSVFAQSHKYNQDKLYFLLKLLENSVLNSLWSVLGF